MTKSKGSIAVVTGALSGIGEAAAERLAYDTSRRGAQARERPFELQRLGEMSDGSLQAGVSEVEQREVRIDLLVNNAGFAQERRRNCSPAASR